MVSSIARVNERGGGLSHSPAASYGWQAIPMHYTYILESDHKPGTYYRGHTSDLTQRLREHNAGILIKNYWVKRLLIRLFSPSPRLCTVGKPQKQKEG